MIEVTAKKLINDESKVATILFDSGENLDEMVEKFTAAVVFTNARASFKITAQSAIRRYLEAGLDESAITAKMATWKPGVAMERTVDPVAAIVGAWGTMSEAAKADLLKKLKK